VTAPPQRIEARGIVNAPLVLALRLLRLQWLRVLRDRALKPMDHT
jgi:hypothetical protein